MSQGGLRHVVSPCPAVLSLWICSQPYCHLWPLNPACSAHRCGWGLCEEALALESSLSHLLTQVRGSSWDILNQILTRLLVFTVPPCFLHDVHIFFSFEAASKRIYLYTYCFTFLFGQDSFETLNLWFYCSKIHCTMYDSATPWNSICNLISFIHFLQRWAHYTKSLPALQFKLTLPQSRIKHD